MTSSRADEQVSERPAGQNLVEAISATGGQDRLKEVPLKFDAWYELWFGHCPLPDPYEDQVRRMCRAAWNAGQIEALLSGTVEFADSR